MLGNPLRMRDHVTRCGVGAPTSYFWHQGLILEARKHANNRARDSDAILIAHHLGPCRRPEMRRCPDLEPTEIQPATA